jgi:hypothetical protein
MRHPHEMDHRAVGARVYGTGRPNATAGTVDPSGYVGRGLRSGLAKSILGGPRRGPDPTALVGETVARTPTATLAAMLISRGRRRSR